HKVRADGILRSEREEEDKRGRQRAVLKEDRKELELLCFRKEK
ncbi:hypothetical protein DNTS_008832, partial [Danionella cerebrum]